MQATIATEDSRFFYHPQPGLPAGDSARRVAEREQRRRFLRRQHARAAAPRDLFMDAGERYQTSYRELREAWLAFQLERH